MISPLKPRDVQLSVKQAGMFQGIKSVGLSQPKNVSSEIEDCSDEWNQETLLKRIFIIQEQRQQTEQKIVSFKHPSG